MVNRNAIALYTGYKPPYCPNNGEHLNKRLAPGLNLNVEVRPQQFSS